MMYHNTGVNVAVLRLVLVLVSNLPSCRLSGGGDVRHRLWLYNVSKTRHAHVSVLDVTVFDSTSCIVACQ